MNSHDLDLSISIVNTNNRDLLKECLQSIYDTTTSTKFEIIVVDNVSTDGSVEMVQDCFPEVKLIINESRKGYGNNHNLAYEVSQGRYFLVFNEDMIVLNGALDTMFDAIEADDRVGVLGCRLLNPDRTLQVSCMRYDTLGTQLFNCLFLDRLFPRSKMRNHLYWWDHDSERDVDCVMGSCLLIPRKVIEETGLFDEQFFVYEEETDLCKRIKEAGWIIRFTPSAEIVHYGGQTSGVMSAYMAIVYTDSVIKFFKKHYGSLQGGLVWAVRLLRALLRLGVWTFVGIAKGRSSEVKQKLSMYRAVAFWLLKPGHSLKPKESAG